MNIGMVLDRSHTGIRAFGFSPHPILHPQTLSRNSEIPGRPRYSVLDPGVDNPESTLASFNRQFSLNASEKEAVEWAWPMEMGDTMFNVVIAIAEQRSGMNYLRNPVSG